MRLAPGFVLALSLAGLSGGCTSDDYVRSEGVTPAAGNAQAVQYRHADGRSLAARRPEHQASCAGPARHAREWRRRPGSQRDDGTDVHNQLILICY